MKGMSYFSSRFSEQLAKVGLTKYRLAKLAGVPEPTVVNITNGKRRPSDEFLAQMAQVSALQVDEARLKSWRLLDDYPVPVVMAAATAQLQSDSALNAFAQALSATDHNDSDGQRLPLLLKMLEDHGLLEGVNTQLAMASAPTASAPSEGLAHQLTPVQHFKRLPCKGRVAAGRLTFAEAPQDVIYYDWGDLHFDDDTLFCLRVEGTSMMPMIPNGAILLVRPAKQWRSGGIYVIKTTDHKTTCKLVEVSHDGLLLLPINPQFEPVDATKLDIARAYEVLEYKVLLV